MSDDRTQHEPYMRRCLELAASALESGEAPVGAIVVLDGVVIGEGVEGVRARADVTAHAEILAVRAACERAASLDLTGATLYTTVEPCPMCAYAIRLARVSVVVSGARTSETDASWGGWRVLTTPEVLPRRPVPTLVRDVLASECRTLHGRKQS